MSEMPKEIGVCAFVDGTFEVYPDSPNVPPATKYVRADLCTTNEEALVKDWCAYGVAATINGKRIDPQNLYINPNEEALKRKDEAIRYALMWFSGNISGDAGLVRYKLSEALSGWEGLK